MDLESTADRIAPKTAAGTPRQLVQVYNGGSMPTNPNYYYATHPVLLGGSESEGVGSSTSVDSSQTMFVDVLGEVPSAGTLLVAHAIGNRWVAELGAGGGGPGETPCSPCGIPKQNLTVSWTNVFTGPGSATLTYTPSPDTWLSGCVDEQIYQILCSDGQIQFTVSFFTSGECPTGQGNYCSNLRAYPFGLTLTSYTCSPFSLTFDVDPNCPAVEGPGYASFTITQ
jgi:hypothetical protein